MTNSKDSFVMYSSWYKTFDMLTPEQSKELILMILKYGGTQEIKQSKEQVVNVAFSMMQANMDRDRHKYEETLKKRQEAGRRGGRPKAGKA